MGDELRVKKALNRPFPLEALAIKHILYSPLRHHSFLDLNEAQDPSLW